MNKVFELFPGAKLGIAAFTLCLTAASLTAAPKPNSPPTLQPVILGSAATFAVLAGTGVTNAGNSHTVINGDLGLYPAAGTAITGFTGENDTSNCCGIVKGTIDDTGSGEPGTETTAAAHAVASLGIAIQDAKGRACPAGQAIPCLLPSAELGGHTFTPGVYNFKKVATLTGDVTLSGDGVYIFQLGSLTVNPGGSVVLAGANAANVFWVATQATLNSTAAFAGTILSTTSVTFTAAAGGTALTGRALAQTVVSFAGADTVTLPK
jgi:Ice-binding-like